jgi:hypothetical protein
MLTLLLALTIATTPGHHATTPHDAYTFANAATTHATPLVSARLLLAVAWVESTWHPAPTSNPNHCGPWQQNPAMSGMWGDDCADGQCRQPGGMGVDCEELSGDVYRAAEVASRHLHYVIHRRGLRGGLCRYHGQPMGSPGCVEYLARVDRALSLVTP